MRRFIALLLLGLLIGCPLTLQASVSVETTRQVYTGSGTTGPFPYSFKIFAATDLEVTRVAIATGTATTLVKDVDYTVSGAGLDAGGNVTLTTALTSDYQLVIRRKMPYLQPQSYTANQPFTAATLNATFDRLAMLSQQLDDQAKRSLQLPLNTAPAASPVYLPPPVADMSLCWDHAASQLTLCSASIVIAPWSLADDNTITTDRPVNLGATRYVATQAAMIAALADASVSNVMVTGDFSAASSVTVPDGKRIYGFGSATLRHTGTANYPLLILGSDTIVDGVTFYGIATSYTGAGGDMVASPYEGVHIDGDRNRITNCRFFEVDSYGVYIDQGDWNYITGNLIRNSTAPTAGTRGRYGIGVAGGLYNIITGNQLENLSTAICAVKVDGTYTGYVDLLKYNQYTNNVIAHMSEHGMYISSGSYQTISGNSINDIWGIGIRNRTNWSTVSNNTINTYGPMESATASGIGMSEPSAHCVCTGNNITTKYVGIYAGGEGIGAFKTAQGFGPTYVMGYNLIADNTLYCDDPSDVAARVAIRFLTTLAADQDYMQKNAIVRNKCYGFNTGLVGMYFEGLELVGNEFYGVGSYVGGTYYGHGIYLINGYRDVRILDNIVQDFPGMGISLLNGEANLELLGNRVTHAGASWAMQVGNSPTGVVFRGNKILGTPASYLSLSDTAEIRGEQRAAYLGTIAATPAVSIPIFVADGPCKILDVLLLNAVDVTQSDTDYSTYNIYNRGADGTATDQIGTSATTKVTGGVAVKAYDPISLGKTAILADADGFLEADTAIAYYKAYAGTGQALTNALAVIRYVEY